MRHDCLCFQNTFETKIGSIQVWLKIEISWTPNENFKVKQKKIIKLKPALGGSHKMLQNYTKNKSIHKEQTSSDTKYSDLVFKKVQFESICGTCDAPYLWVVLCRAAAHANAGD